MSTHETQSEGDNEFNLINCGWSYELVASTGLEPGTRSFWPLKLLLIILITWIPLVLLSLISGHFAGSAVKVPFVQDLESQIRFLLVVPLLELSKIAVQIGLGTQSRHLKEMGLIPAADLPQFLAARTRTLNLRRSQGIELLLVGLSFALPLLFRIVLGVSEGASSWERIDSSMTLAGWWQTLVSLPLLYFLLLRWMFIIVCWDLFLFRISRIPLALTPTHPDKVGGLGFLGWGIVSFSPLLMCISIVFAAGAATEILQSRESLDSLKYHCLVFAILVLALVYVPLLGFARQLSNCRFNGLLEFGKLVWRHDRDFEEKWMGENADAAEETLLGNADVQSMADIATCYNHINEMWLIPFDAKAFAVLILSLLVPMAPLLATTVQLREIVMKIGELLI